MSLSGIARFAGIRPAFGIVQRTIRADLKSFPLADTNLLFLFRMLAS